LVVTKEGTVMMYDNWGWGWGGWVLMTLVMIVFWAAVITAVVLAVRSVAGSRRPGASRGPSGPARAEDLLAERFARGEIDDDEYRQRLTLLRENR
jgi:putative membrane protein